MKNRPFLTRFIAAMFLSGLIMATPLTVAAEDSSSTDKNWDFSLAPLYIWGTNIDGDTSLPSPADEIKVDNSEIFDSLEGAFTLNFSGVHESRFGFFFDLVYLNVGKKEDTGLGAILDYNLKTLVSQFSASYRLTDNDLHAFDAMLGARYVKLEVDAEFDNLPISGSESRDLWDPIIGGRYTWRFAEKWNLNLYGDIGGFGVGSDFTWQGLGVIDFWAWKHVAISAGYRALNYQFEDTKANRDFELDLLVHGPIIGIRFGF
jgi:hypothetical protein